MSCAVVTIGNELTRGELVDTNAAWLSAKLTDLGFEVTEAVQIDDDRGRIVGTLRRLSDIAELVLITRGLDPVTEDLTASSVADVLGVHLSRDPASLDHIRRRLERLGRAMTESSERQADFPETAEILPNPVGTAPGFCVAAGRARLFFIPGSSLEMERMFEEQIVPRVRHLAPNELHQVHLRTFGMPEGAVSERLAGVEAAYPGVVIRYRTHFPEIFVKILARGRDRGAARELGERAAAEVRHRLADVVFGEAEDTFAGTVGKVLRQRGVTLAIAESCTGGLVGHMLTLEAGASDFLLVDAVTYANSAKTRFVGVNEETIRGHGAASAEVCAQMAEGVRRISGADVALSLTGVAGPTGGSDDTPVGTVFIGVATAQGTTVKRRLFSGERSQIQRLAAYAGLAMVKRAMS